MPFGEEAALRRVVERLADSGTTSFLAVLKRFGEANQAPLSFPKPGWTLALDVPGGAPGSVELLAELDDVVLDAGGRHYLAKDAAPHRKRSGAATHASPSGRRSATGSTPTTAGPSDQSRRLRLTDHDRHDRAGVTAS